MAENHTSSTQTTHATTRTNTASTLLAIAGIIILLIIAIGGLLHLASLSGNWFGSLTPKKASSIAVAAPNEATSGEIMRVSWTYTPSSRGTYALLYQCQDGVRLALPTTDKSFVPLPCGAAFTLGNATSSIAILPLNTGTSTRSETITMLFIPSATSSTSALTPAASGSAIVAIHPGSMRSTATTTKQTGTKTTKSYGSKSSSSYSNSYASGTSYSGLADLAVTLISLTADGYGNGIAIFDIANVGGSASGSYYFTAQVPTYPSYTYYSPAQASLHPGDHIVNTLRFTQAIAGLFSVSVDPQGLLREATKANNTTAQYLAAPYRTY